MLDSLSPVQLFWPALRQVTLLFLMIMVALSSFMVCFGRISWPTMQVIVSTVLKELGCRRSMKKSSMWIGWHGPRYLQWLECDSLPDLVFSDGEQLTGHLTRYYP